VVALNGDVDEVPRLQQAGVKAALEAHRIDGGELQAEPCHDIEIGCALEGVERPIAVVDEHLLESHSQGDVDRTCSDGHDRLSEGGRGAGAGVLDVDHRYALYSHLAQDTLAADLLLALQHPGHRIGRVHRLDIFNPQAGVVECSEDCYPSKILETRVGESSKRVHSDSRNRDLVHCRHQSSSASKAEVTALRSTLP